MSRYDASRHVAQRRVSLLVRNLPLDTRAEELRAKFERYGEVRDVYLPRDYYTQRPKGFGFIEFLDARDAEEALYQLDRSMMGGREITVVLSKESRKSPREMLTREDQYPNARPSGRYGARRGRSRSPDRRSPRRRPPSRDRSYSRGRSYSRSRSRSRGRGRSPSPRNERSPSPAGDRYNSRERPRFEEDRERSRSPAGREYSD